MIAKLRKWAYRTGLLRAWETIDNLRYLKRLERGKAATDTWYYSDKDQAQAPLDGHVVVRSRCAGRPVYFHCQGDEHVEQSILRSGGFSAHILTAIRDHLRPGHAYVDIGAHIGF